MLSGETVYQEHKVVYRSLIIIGGTCKFDRLITVQHSDIAGARLSVKVRQIISTNFIIQRGGRMVSPLCLKLKAAASKGKSLLTCRCLRLIATLFPLVRNVFW